MGSQQAIQDEEKNEEVKSEPKEGFDEEEIKSQGGGEEKKKAEKAAIVLKLLMIAAMMTGAKAQRSDEEDEGWLNVEMVIGIYTLIIIIILTILLWGCLKERVLPLWTRSSSDCGAEVGSAPWTPVKKGK